MRTANKFIIFFYMIGAGLANAENASAPAAKPQPLLSTTQCWQNWLNSQRLQEGPNRAANGDVRFVAQAVETMSGDFSDNKWVALRAGKFGEARLNARAALAEYVGQEVSSSASGSWFKSGGDQVPAINAAADALSIAEKAQKLTGLELDNEIKKYDPNWQGDGKTDKERMEHAVAVQDSFKEKIKSRSTALLAGATEVVQCEGPSEPDGTDSASRYEILVGMVWSPKLAYKALAMVNPAITLPPGNDRQSIKERIAASDLTTSLGSRVWTDENGELVIVGFGSSTATSLKSADREFAKQQAITAIARFEAETIVSNNTLNSDISNIQYTSGDTKSFDTSEFNRKINATAATIRLKGVFQVGEWRGKHPVSEKPMQVMVSAWKPSSSEAAEAAGNLMQPATDNGKAASTVDVPVKQGASSNVTDY